MRNIYGMTLDELEEYFLSIGEKKFKAIQIFEWLYQKKINNFEIIWEVVIIKLFNDKVNKVIK